MSGVQFDIRVITGNSGAAVDGIANGIEHATANTGKFSAAISKLGTTAFLFNNIQTALEGVNRVFQGAIEPGIKLNDNLKDLQAITDVTDAKLSQISDRARDNAKAFGIDASSAVDGYKIVLSKLGPEIANNSDALAAMGNTSAILSKQMGGDVAGATGVLTTAMNQYGISIDDPIKASKDMALMMNIMSAAAQEGSAEMPQIAAALEQAGMMAKNANVPFNELNAAIQLMDKAGKKGAEGGVALRNAFSILGEGRFMPEKQKQMLIDAGVDVEKLGDKTLSFSKRLELLKPIMNDTAALTLMFGKENVAAGTALIQNSGEIEKLTKKITGTNSATEMANTKMTSYTEVMNRIGAKVKDFGISIFNATEPFLPFINIAGPAISMIGSFGLAMSAVSQIADTKFGIAIGKAGSAVVGFVKNLALGIASVVRQGAVMGFNAVVAVGSYVGSLIIATAAQLGLNAAMYANPIGIVVLGIAAAVAAVVVLIKYWDEIWAAIKSFTAWIFEHSPFKFLIDVVDNIFPGFKQAFVDLWEWLKKKFTDLIDWFKETWNSIKGVFGFGDDSQTKTVVKDTLDDVVSGINIQTTVTDVKPTKDKLKDSKDKTSKTSKEMSSNISSGGSRPTTINLTIHKLQDQIVVHTTNLQTGAKEAGRQIVEEILMALNSVNGKASFQ